MNLDGKIAVVTGGASGLGNAILKNLANQGARVVGLDVDIDGDATFNGEAEVLKCDIRNAEQVESVVSRIEEEIGTPSVLINTAGIMASSPLLNFLNPQHFKSHDDLFDDVISVNLKGTYLVSSRIGHAMVRKRKKGVIVNFSSISAQGNLGQTAYSASKAAVEAMTVTWSKELGPLGVRCNAIAPGFIDTPGARSALHAEQMDRWKELTPLKRLGEIDEVISVVMLIIENDFLNGSVLEVHGGLRI